MTGSLDSIPRLRADDNKIFGGGGKADNKNMSMKPKNAKSGIQTCIGAMGKPIFLTPSIKKAFN